MSRTLISLFAFTLFSTFNDAEFFQGEVGPQENLLFLDLRAVIGEEKDRGTCWAYDAAKAVVGVARD